MRPVSGAGSACELRWSSDTGRAPGTQPEAGPGVSAPWKELCHHLLIHTRNSGGPTSQASFRHGDYSSKPDSKNLCPRGAILYACRGQ